MRIQISLACLPLLCLFVWQAPTGRCQPLPVTTEQADLLTAEFSRIQDFKDRFWSTDIADDQHIIAQEAELHAQDTIRSHVYGYGYTCRATAALLRNSGANDKAEQLLLALADDPETPHDCVSALRQLGQLQESSQRWMDALRTYERAVNYALQNPRGAIERDSGSFGVCANNLGAIATMLHQSELAEFAYRAVTEHPSDAIERGAILTAYHGLIGLYRRTSDDASRLRVYEEIFQRYPRFGLEGNEGVGTRIAYSDLVHPDRDSDDYLAELLDIWLGNTLTDPSVIFTLGDRLTTAYAACGDIRASHDVRVEVCDRLRELDIPDTRRSKIRDRLLLSGLLRVIDLAAIPGGNPDQAEAALQEANNLHLGLHGRRIDPTSVAAYHRAIDRQR